MKQIIIEIIQDMNLHLSNGEKITLKKGEQFNIVGEIDNIATQIYVIHKMNTVPMGISKNLENVSFKKIIK